MLKPLLALVFAASVFAESEPSAARATPAQAAEASELAAKLNDFGARQRIGEVLGGTEGQRIAMVQALGRSASSQARLLVAPQLHAASTPVVMAAIEAMAQLGSAGRSDSDEMASCLRHPDPTVRQMALGCLGAWRDVRDVPAIIEVLHDGDAKVKQKAQDTLKQLTGRDLGAEERPWREWYQQAREENGARFDKLRDQLRSRDAAVVVAAIHELRDLTAIGPQVADELVPLLNDDNAAVAAAACAAVYKLRPQVLTPEQRELAAKDAGPTIRIPKAAVAPPEPKTPVWPAFIVIAAIGAAAWWWVRRLMTATRAMGVNEVVALAQRQAGLGSERSAPVVKRAPPKTTVSGVTPKAAPAPAKAPVKPPAKPRSDRESGKSGEKIFKLD